MLKVLTNKDDLLADIIKDDPVRPEIPIEERINKTSNIFVLLDSNSNPLSVVCVKFLEEIPAKLEELYTQEDNAHVAVFYTIWSYAKGAGCQIIKEATHWIEKTHESIDTFVTYSPKTDAAKSFHLKNGATIYRENEDSINFLYK